ncbi:MAG: DUF1801 domain-containing protein [Planctomycetota bacterium]|jgi:uncharacterized protein YdhG (YjbR/CyaY superfamily)
MNPTAESFEEYLGKIDPDSVPTTRKVIQIMRKELKGADEDVRWGIAIFSRDGEDIAGISSRKGFYSLYVPQGEVRDKFLERLGKVDPGKGCVRFKRIEDIELPELRKMVRELSEGAGK